MPQKPLSCFENDSGLQQFERRGFRPAALVGLYQKYYGNNFRTDWFAWLAMDSAEISSCCRVCNVSKLALSWF